VTSWYQRKRTRELALVACFLAPALSIFFLYRLLPLGWNVLLSFQSWSPLKAAKWIGVDHYEEMLLDDDVFWQALVNTLIFIAASPLAIAAALGIALLVNSDLRGAAIYRTIVFLSYPLMTVAFGIIWRWLYDERGGFINYVLRSGGLIDNFAHLGGLAGGALVGWLLAPRFEVDERIYPPQVVRRPLPWGWAATTGFLALLVFMVMTINPPIR